MKEEGTAVHLAREHGVYLFLSGPTEEFLDGKTAAQTSCCNYTSKSCRISFDNNANYNSFDFFFQSESDTHGIVIEGSMIRP